MRGVLTPRQTEVLVMISGGKPWKALVDELRISPMTLKSHLHSVRERLGAQNTTHAVAIAIKRGLI